MLHKLTVLSTTVSIWMLIIMAKCFYFRQSLDFIHWRILLKKITFFIQNWRDCETLRKNRTAVTRHVLCYKHTLQNYTNNLQVSSIQIDTIIIHAQNLVKDNW